MLSFNNPQDGSVHFDFFYFDYTTQIRFLPPVFKYSVIKNASVFLIICYSQFPGVFMLYPVTVSCHVCRGVRVLLPCRIPFPKYFGEEK